MNGNYSGSNSVGNQSTPLRQPTDGESKTAAKVIVIEIIIVIFLLGFIVITLSFLKIISLGSLLPQSVKNLTSDIPIGGPMISIESEINGYKAELVDKSGLIDLLKSWKTFDKSYDIGEAGSTGKGPLRKINIIITDKFDSSKFPWVLYKNKDEKEYLSSNIRLSPETLNITIFIGDSIISDPSQNISSYIQTAFISTLYKMTHPISPDEVKKREKLITDQLRDLNTRGKIYFKVQK